MVSNFSWVYSNSIANAELIYHSKFRRSQQPIVAHFNLFLMIVRSFTSSYTL